MNQTDPATKDEHDEIVGVICEELKRLGVGDEKLTAATDITTDINVDSVAIMDMVFALEEKYDVAVPLNDLAEVYKIGELASLIQNLKAGN